MSKRRGKSKKKIFKRSIIYFLGENEYTPLYIGVTMNPIKRKQVHFSNSKKLVNNSTFHNYCLENGINKSKYTMYICDLGDICKTDLLLIERYFLNIWYDTTIVNKLQTKKLNKRNLRRLYQLDDEYDLTSLVRLKGFETIDDFLERINKG